MKIDYANLKQQYLKMKPEIDEAVLGVLDSTRFIHGSEVENLEAVLSAFTGAKFCIACSSGTDALLLSLMAIDIKPGDEIITTPFTFIATASVIALLGATPVFVDIDESTYNINSELIEEKVTARTKAIIPVSLFGQCPNFNEINSIADKYNLTVIEDACQSLGAEYHNKKSCNLSAIGCTSFFPSKPLGGYGDGGAIFTSDNDLAHKMRSLLNHGQQDRYVHNLIGINGRLDAIQAAILNVKLEYFVDEIAKRNQIAAKYNIGLGDIVKIPLVKDDRTSVYAQYSIRVNDRNSFIKKMNAHEIPTAVHYPCPLYRQEAFSTLKINPKDYPIVEAVTNDIISIPMNAYLKEEEQDYIIGVINSV